MIKKIIFTGTLVPVLFAQTSAFDAGNINLEHPYGLTESEKVLLENKKKVETLSKDYTGVDFKTNKALERIEGMESLVESLGNKTHNYESKLLELEKFSNEKNESVDKELKQIKAQVYKNSNAINQLKIALSELTSLVEGLATGKSKSLNPESKKIINDVLSPAQKLSKAIKLYKNKDYVNSEALFLDLVNIKHKPAQSNFYLGQIAYEQKKYKDAIYYYKTSSILYKAQHVKNPNMPLVLLNTANSLKALNENAQANNFYTALKEQFPNSKEAKNLK